MTRQSKILIAALIVFFGVVAVFGIWMHNNPVGQQVFEWIFPEGIAR